MSTVSAGGPGSAWVSLIGNLAILALCFHFHRWVDEDLFAGDARRVFSRVLAGVYLAGALLFWAASLAAFAFLIATGRSSWQTHNPGAVLAGFVLIGGYVALVWVIEMRAHAVAGRGEGPLPRLGRFVRLGYGTGVPAAWRRLRSAG